MTEWVQRVPIAVVTAGRDGALLYVNGERYELRARPALEVDPTGAGDVFAATFLARYRRDADPWDAAEADRAKDVVALGDLGYWPPGHAFCIFFGPTPASRGDEIRPASPVNVVGRVSGDATVFKKVRAGTRVTLERGGS